MSADRGADDFKFVNVRNARWLLPPWTVDYWSFCYMLNNALISAPRFRKLDWSAPLPFWCEVKMATGGVRFVEPEGGVNLSGHLIIDGDDYQIVLPLNTFYRDHYLIQDCYSVYAHSIQTDVPLAYIGLTRRKWYTRLSEHRASAAAGSNYFFHAALREHQTRNILHRVFLTGSDEKTAMDLEEEFVANMSLYPLGLNMIPGGYAGLKYLSSFGVRRRTTDGVDAEIRSLMARASVKGRPNPLCSARWYGDPDYAERVICGHSGRLTADEVRKVRNLNFTGRSVFDIATLLGRGLKQVERLMKGMTYSRIS